MGQTTTWSRVAQTLNDLDFPAAREDIVQHAQQHGGDAGTLRLLRALPPATYRNIGEVRSSVPLDSAAEEGRTPTERARQARSPHVGVAEYLRDR